MSRSHKAGILEEISNQEAEHLKKETEEIDQIRKKMRQENWRKEDRIQGNKDEFKYNRATKKKTTNAEQGGEKNLGQK